MRSIRLRLSTMFVVLTIAELPVSPVLRAAPKSNDEDRFDFEHFQFKWILIIQLRQLVSRSRPSSALIRVSCLVVQVRSGQPALTFLTGLP